MQTYENQKTVTTKSAQHNKNNIYATIGVEAMEEAMALLKHATFKLWCYMAKNQNNYTFALSKVDACRFCRISEGTYKAAVNELISVGYLVNTDGNHYDFYEKLPSQEEEMLVTKRAEVTD